MLLTVASTGLRELGRRRVALLFVFLLPCVFYLARIDVSWQAVRFLAIGVGWAVATLSLFSHVGARRLDRRLARGSGRRGGGGLRRCGGRLQRGGKRGCLRHGGDLGPCRMAARALRPAVHAGRRLVRFDLDVGGRLRRRRRHGDGRDDDRGCVLRLDQRHEIVRSDAVVGPGPCLFIGVVRRCWRRIRIAVSFGRRSSAGQCLAERREQGTRGAGDRRRRIAGLGRADRKEGGKGRTGGCRLAIDRRLAVAGRDARRGPHVRNRSHHIVSPSLRRVRGRPLRSGRRSASATAASIAAF